jgi:hypothetical protein
MKYEDMIEGNGEPKADGSVEAPPEDDLPVDAVADTFEGTLEREPQNSVKPWKAVVLTGLLAGLIGAGGGAFGVYAGLKAQTPDAAPDISADLAAVTTPLNAKIETLERRLIKAEASVRDVKSSSKSTPTPIDLSSIESRLEALETTPTSEIDPAAIAALQAAQADGFEWPDVSTLETRLTGLEAEISNLPDSTQTEVSSDLGDRLEALETDFLAANIGDRLSAMDSRNAEMLEGRISALENRGSVAPIIQRISVLAFPKDALLKAAEDNTEGGFMKKALSKHVRVKDDDNPRILIDQIEADISEGRLEAAAIKFERLPAPVKVAGQAWYESVKASL